MIWCLRTSLKESWEVRVSFRWIKTAHYCNYWCWLRVTYGLISLYPSEFLAEDPCNKWQNIKRKSNRSLLTCIFLINMWNIKKNWVTPWDGPRHHLKCHLPLKTKEKVMERQWEVSRRSSLNYSRVGCVMQISSFLKTVLQQDSAVI